MRVFAVLLALLLSVLLLHRDTAPAIAHGPDRCPPWKCHYSPGYPGGPRPPVIYPAPPRPGPRWHR